MGPRVYRHRASATELLAPTAACRTPPTPPARELPVQYPDYAVWQRDRFSGDELDRLLDHWRERLTGATDLVIGSPVAGRVHPKLEGLIGFFVNILPLRLAPTGQTPFVELLDQARDRAYDAFEHDEVPFARLVDELGIRRSAGHNPLFQVALGVERSELVNESPVGARWVG